MLNIHLPNATCLAPVTNELPPPKQDLKEIFFAVGILLCYILQKYNRYSD